MPPPSPPEIGDRKGKRVIIARQARTVTVECDCGNVSKVTFVAWRGHGRSCGCLRRAVTKDRSITHGHSASGRNGGPSGTYNTWRAMIRRCTKESASDFAFYGGRGISICERWLTFELFLADMGERPTDMTIERRDSNGNYEEGNCLWASRKRQSRNRRDTLWEPHEPEQVRWLHELGYRQVDIAAFFETTQSRISEITTGKLWAAESAE